MAHTLIALGLLGELGQVDIVFDAHIDDLPAKVWISVCFDKRAVEAWSPRRFRRREPFDCLPVPLVGASGPVGHSTGLEVAEIGGQDCSAPR